MVAAQVCHAAGGIAVSLNLREDVEARWMSGRLKSDPVRLLQNSLNRQLKRAGVSDLAYMFQFEQARNGRLHLHGMILPGEIGADGLEAVKRALRAAVGRILGQAGSTQLHFQPLTDAKGWVRYMSKAEAGTRRRTGFDKLSFMSRSMSRQAGRHHDAVRRTRLPRSA